MAFVTVAYDFAPPVAPSVTGAAYDRTAKVIENKLGDGYSQRARDGLNHVQTRVRLVWLTLSRADADDIEAFFDLMGGDRAFRYGLPPSNTPVRAWVCTSWRRDPNTELTDTFEADLVEVFDV